nr:extracellular matrix-binding protein EbhB [Bactrocera oleae]
MSSGREEGEIDSEEDGLRKRIHELENENAEYEKIKRISESYGDKYGNMYRLNEFNDWEAVQRAGQVPTDVSSISSDEFPSPKKKKHKRNKKAKCKMHERRALQRSHRCTHQRHKHSKKHQHHHRRERLINTFYESRGIETISLDTTDNSEYEKDNYSIATMDIESTDENDADITLPLSREELRLALGRGKTERKNNVCSLKERLQPDKFIALDNMEKVQILEESAANSNDAENVVEINSDNSISIEEQELRLIALRSAIMRKHATRKKRNDEIAYSPTDFDELLVEPVSLVDTDIEELEGDMEISPASSPRLLLSPIQCDDEQNSNISLDTEDNQVDNKSVDMELASSDSEQEDNSKNIINTDMSYAQMHDIPLPAGLPMDSGVSLPLTYDYASNINHAMAYDMYMPAMQYSSPMELPPPLLPMSALTSTTQPLDAYDVTSQNATSSDDVTCVKHEVVIEPQRVSLSPKSSTMEIIQQEELPEECSDEEEAEALRALLLSQRQMAKTIKANSLTQIRKQSPTYAQKTFEDVKSSKSMIKAPALQPSILSECNVKPTPTESILKEAVRRLKVKTFASCENAHAQDVHTVSETLAPRLKIKAFARCREVEEVAIAHAQTTHIAENATIAFKKQSTNFHNAFSNHEEFPSSTEGIQCKSTPEILDAQTNSPENVTTFVHNKRRLDNMDTVEPKLTVKELPQLAESLHSSEDSNSLPLQQSQRTQHTFETQAKKLKRSLEQTNHAPVADLNDLQGKMHTQEIMKLEGDANSSGEKENKEISSATMNKNENATHTVTKAKSTAKPVAKTLKVTPKNKASITLATAKNTTVPPKISVAPPSKVIKPLAQQLKIVKPNKVINKNLEVQQRTQKADNLSIPKKSDANNQPSRILTPTTLPNIKVKKLIIQLGDTDSSSEDEEIIRNQTLERCIGLATARTQTPDSLSYILNENVYGSKGCSTPTEMTNAQTNDDLSNASVAKDTTVGEAFEKKLENFLKTIRSKTLQTNEHAEHAHARVRKLSSSNGVQTRTPTAVRSLPIASQEEYKRLVHRMKILERQKQLKKMQKSLIEDAEKYTKAKQDNAENNVRRFDDANAPNTNCANVKTTSSGTQTCNEAHSAVTEKSTEVHSEKSTPNESLTIMPASPTVTPPRNQKALTDKLRSWETIYTSISNNIITRLDKSLQLVNEAKSAKIAKMRHEQRLKELRHEMEQTQRKLKEEQVKITRIHPQICASNELISKLKQKRAKVLEMAVKLGKSVKGDDYRLNNDLKNEIAHKTKGLATHIKLVNSIRYSDLEILDKLPANNAKTTNAINAPQSQLACDELVSKQLPSTDHNKRIACDVHESAALILSTLAASDTRSEAETETEARAANTNANDKQSNAQESIESCDKQCEVEPAPRLVAADTCIEEVAVEEEQPAPCASVKEVLHEDCAPTKDSTTTKDMEVKLQQGRTLRDYVSPLLHLRSESGKWNPNDIICPYELMGQCEDKDCSYTHLKMCI